MSHAAEREGNEESFPAADEHLEVHRLKFSANSAEFFRIWIVNLLLSVLTLGIYSAWAKVRTRRYLYGSTSVAGDSFEYHARPVAILKGRLVALAAVGAVTLSSTLSPIAGFVAVLLLIIGLPFIVVRSLRFNAIMTSWRGIRFDFRGNAGGAAGAYVGWPLLGTLLLGLGLPYSWYRLARYNFDGHRLGLSRFRLTARAGDFYRIGLAMLALVLLYFVLVGIPSLFLESSDSPSSERLGFLAGSLVAPLAIYAVGYAIFSGMRFKAVFGKLELGPHRLKTSLRLGPYLAIALTNLLGMLLTFGLFYPWAKVRMMRYQLTSLSVEAIGLDEFLAAERQRTTALGDEFGEAFDLDISV